MAGGWGACGEHGAAWRASGDRRRCGCRCEEWEPDVDEMDEDDEDLDVLHPGASVGHSGLHSSLAFPVHDAELLGDFLEGGEEEEEDDVAGVFPIRLTSIRPLDCSVSFDYDGLWFGTSRHSQTPMGSVCRHSGL